MSYFDDNEDRIIYGGHRRPSRDTIRKGYQSPPGHNGGSQARPRDPATRGVKAEPGSELARARQAAHRAFDPLWQSGKMTRSNAYTDLARRLNLTKAECHMVLFDVATCRRVVEMFLTDDFEDITP